MPASTKAFTTAKRSPLRRAGFPFALPLPWCRAGVEPLAPGSRCIGGGSSPTFRIGGSEVIRRPPDPGRLRRLRPVASSSKGGARRFAACPEPARRRDSKRSGSRSRRSVASGGRIQAPGLSVRMPRLQVPKRNRHGVIVGVFIGDQDKGIIGPEFQFRRFAE